MLAAGDIYWEGEEDNVNEFLEVKEDDPGVIGHLKRFKRQFSFPDFGEYNTYFFYFSYPLTRRGDTSNIY